MSVFTAKTGISSILKTYSPGEREKNKTAAINKVRFELPKEQGVIGVIQAVLNNNDYVHYNEFISYLRECALTECEFKRVISEARKSVHLLKPIFSLLVQTLLSLDWINRDHKSIKEYKEFYIDVLVAHSKFTNFAISKLIEHWIPCDSHALKWPNACPNEELKKQLENIHKLLARVLNVIPMTFDIALEEIEKQFPYYKKPSHVIAGYVFNILWLLEYKPIFTNYAIQILFHKLLLLDVNAPRDEIDYEEDKTNVDDEAIFQMEGFDEKSNEIMSHPIAETLDICMIKIFEFLLKFNTDTELSKNTERKNLTDYFDDMEFLKILLTSFDNVILPSHNTHHVQFILFYYCSFKAFLVEKFLNTLWSKVSDPNVCAPIRQAAVGYIASFLARAKFVSCRLLKYYLLEMCNWCHQYIQRSDSIRSNISLKANIVFYSVCQAIFYIIAFRSRDLTIDKKSILFLQSLQLSALVSCNFNPLRVCLPAVATAFAGVTRAYQLAYCHTILERNARRKLATVYTNETSTPEEILETFFPFDPYLLKKSGKYIVPLYLQYQASEAEEDHTQIENSAHHRRKRGDSEMAEDIDDFIVDKRHKFAELSRSNDKEIQFTYGLSPGFNI